MQEVNEARARSQPGLWQDGGEVRQEAGRGACREVLVLSWVHVHVESGEWRAGNVGSAAQAGAAQAHEPGSWVSPLGDRRLLVFQRTGAVIHFLICAQPQTQNDLFTPPLLLHRIAAMATDHTILQSERLRGSDVAGVEMRKPGPWTNLNQRLGTYRSAC